MAAGAAEAGAPVPGAPEAEPRVARAVVLALAAAALPYALLVLRFDNLMDDAFISFRYARHLAEGHGLRFNLDGSVPVEGYSNLLWVLLMAAFERVGLDVTVASRVVSVACGLALLALVARFLAARLALSAPLTALATVFLATLPAFTVWSTGGLETMAFALALFATWTALLGGARGPRPVAAAVLAVTATLLRVDGALLCGVVGLAVLVAPRRPAGTLEALLVAGAAVVAAVALQTLWRVAYHGDWLPNTARVKAGLGADSVQRGALYVLAFLVAVPSCLAALVAALPAALAARGRALSSALAVVLGVAAYAAAVGGDWMPFGRYLVPALPFVGVALGAALRWLDERAPRGALALGSVCVLLSLPPSLGRGVLPRAVEERLHFRLGFPEHVTEHELWEELSSGVDEWVRRARALARCTRSGESVILGAVGATGYYTDLVIHDTYGLTDREVARLDPEAVPTSPGHDKRVEKTFFLPRRPTYWHFYVCRADDPLGHGLGATFEAEPIRRLLRLERHALGPADGYPPGHELRLWRFVSWDLVPDALRPLLDAVAGVDPAEPERALSELRARLDPGSEAARSVERDVLALMDEVHVAEVRIAGLSMRGARLVRPGPESGGYSVDAKLLEEGAGAAYAVPRGEINYTIALEGEPRFAGRPPGWSVIPPGAVHVNRPEGGSVLTLSFLPDGAFAPAPE